MNIESILNKAKSTHNLTEGEVLLLLKSGGDTLCKAADETRQKYVGDGVHMRALIEISNYCFQNCLYCGLRCDNNKVQRYRLEAPQILELVRQAKDLGYKTIVLQSGEDPYFDIDVVTRIVKGVKDLDLALTLSLGEKTYEEYKAYKEAGANRYLLRIETSDKELYERLDPGMSFDNRVRCLRDLQTLGYEVGSGILTGLPGQSLESIAKDILFLKNFPVDMAGIGPFIASPYTPLADKGGNYFELSLKVMAILRLLLPDINIPATTAMESLEEGGRVKALQAGANVIMPNITPQEDAKNYQIYPGKFYAPVTPRQYLFELGEKLKTIGRSIGSGYGLSLRYLKNKPR